MWLFVLSGLLALAGNPVSSSCPIEMNPSRAAVRYKGPFSANCSSFSNQTAGMGWESSNGGVGNTANVVFLPLNIKSVTDWKLRPVCFINFQDEDQCSGTLPVIVYKTPDSVSTPHLRQQGPMVEGEVYRMQCDIVNVAPARNLSVLWYRGNDLLFTETFDESVGTPLNKSSVFSLTAHRDYDGGQIRCEAKLNFWRAGPNIPSMPSSGSYHTTVLYPPTFTNPENETLELTAGSKLTLNCTAAGNPVPVYSWHLPHSIQQADKDQITNDPVLTPSFALTGAYKCTVSSTQGTKTKYFNVIQAKRDHTTLAALIGVFTALGVLLLIGGLFFVTPEGTFSCSKGSYIRGQPTSGPV